jgi:hypothetical protein
MTLLVGASLSSTNANNRVDWPGGQREFAQSRSHPDQGPMSELGQEPKGSARARAVRCPPKIGHNGRCRASPAKGP